MKTKLEPILDIIEDDENWKVCWTERGFDSLEDARTFLAGLDCIAANYDAFHRFVVLRQMEIAQDAAIN